MILDKEDNQDKSLPVCGLKHRVRTPDGELKRYKCCDSRDCPWKEHQGNDDYCSYDRNDQ